MEYAHVTTTEADWSSWSGRNVTVESGGLRLESERHLESAGIGVDAVDVATSNGILYALRPSGAVYRRDPDGELGEEIWPGEAADTPVAIGAADQRLYLATASGTLTVVSTRLRRRERALEIDVDRLRSLAATRTSLYVLDDAEDGSTGRLRRVDGEGRSTTIREGLPAPRDLAVGPEGDCYVLVDGPDGPGIRRFRGRDSAREVAAVDRLSTETDRIRDARALAVVADDDVVVTCGGADAGIYRSGPSLTDFEGTAGFDRVCESIASATVDGSAEECRLYGVVGAEGPVRSLRETRRHVRTDRQPPHSGIATARFDSGAEGTQWHRLTLSFDRPASGTQVRVRYRATDRETEPPRGIAALEPIEDAEIEALRTAGIRGLWDLLDRSHTDLAALVAGATPERAREWRRGALAVIDETSTERWTPVRTANPDDVLLEDATGRYLQVRLELVGTPSASPRVTGCRAYCPRQSYLRYLPEVYEKHEESAEFLERFLSVFESTYVDIEEEIESIGEYLDPQATPREHLDWLGEWLAIDVGEEWPDSARRELLDSAPDLYKRRGTKAGLRALLELYLSHVADPDLTRVFDRERRRLDERAETDAAGNRVADRWSRLDDLKTGLAGGHRLLILEHGDVAAIESDEVRSVLESSLSGPHSFLVMVGPFAREAHREQVESIVASQKPAHTAGTVVELQEDLTLDGDTFLGVNSRLTAGGFTVGQSSLGSDTVLQSAESI